MITYKLLVNMMISAYGHVNNYPTRHDVSLEVLTKDTLYGVSAMGKLSINGDVVMIYQQSRGGSSHTQLSVEEELYKHIYLDLLTRAFKSFPELVEPSGNHDI